MPGRRRRTTTSRRTTTTRTTTTRTATATKAAPRKAAAKAAPMKALPEVPVAGPGERVWVLAVPFRAPAPGASWHAGLQAHVHVGAALPAALRPYEPGPYTFDN